MGSTGPAPPLRVSIDAQAAMLRSWIRQTAERTKVSEMWLSQIFRSDLDNIPGGPDVDVPAALRYLDSRGEVEILETARRPYLAWRETSKKTSGSRLKSCNETHPREGNGAVLPSEITDCPHSQFRAIIYLPDYRKFLHTICTVTGQTRKQRQLSSA
jgi:hypothetical protein